MVETYRRDQGSPTLPEGLGATASFESLVAAEPMLSIDDGVAFDVVRGRSLACEKED